jgi:cytochrome c
MTPKATHRSLLTLVAFTGGMLLAVPAYSADFDADAAENTFKENDCHKCHHATRTKKGPSLKTIAAKYKEKNLGVDEAIKQMTAGQKVKLDDGSEEDHKIIDTKDVKVQTNVAKWMLTR